MDQYGPLLGFGDITCDFLSQRLNVPPELNDLLNLRGLINIPVGNTKAFGSFEGCISTKSRVVNDFNFTQEETNMTFSYNPFDLEYEFSAGWAPVKLQSNIDLDSLGRNGFDKPMPRIGSGLSVIDGIWHNLGDLGQNFTIPDTVSVRKIDSIQTIFDKCSPSPRPVSMLVY